MWSNKIYGEKQCKEINSTDFEDCWCVTDNAELYFLLYIQDLFWDLEKQVGFERDISSYQHIPSMSLSYNPKPSEVIPNYFSAEMHMLAQTLYYVVIINVFFLFNLKLVVRQQGE